MLIQKYYKNESYLVTWKNYSRYGVQYQKEEYEIYFMLLFGCYDYESMIGHDNG